MPAFSHRHQTGTSPPFITNNRARSYFVQVPVQLEVLGYLLRYFLLAGGCFHWLKARYAQAEGSFSKLRAKLKALFPS